MSTFLKSSRSRDIAELWPPVPRPCDYRKLVQSDLLWPNGLDWARIPAKWERWVVWNMCFSNLPYNSIWPPECMLFPRWNDGMVTSHRLPVSTRSLTFSRIQPFPHTSPSTTTFKRSEGTSASSSSCPSPQFSDLLFALLPLHLQSLNSPGRLINIILILKCVILVSPN